MTTDTGPAVNYARIEAALTQHRLVSAQIVELAEMRAAADGSAKCFLMVDGAMGKPLEVSRAVAQGLIDDAIASKAATVAALGAALAQTTSNLP